jgi:hypothetical protein
MSPHCPLNRVSRLVLEGEDQKVGLGDEPEGVLFAVEWDGAAMTILLSNTEVEAITKWLNQRAANER